MDNDLVVEKKEIEGYAMQHNLLPEIMSVRQQVISYQRLSSPYNEVLFRTISAMDSSENDEDDFRSLEFGIKAGNQEYKVSVMKPLETTENLLWYILLITLSAILVILAAAYFINRLALKKLWSPFFDTVNKLNNFSLGKNEPLQLNETKIEEFTLLNNTLETTTNKAQQDYIVLKEFTENASHEMQTPLAIIQSKLDLLVQDEKLSESQSVVAQSVYESIQKLSRLNQSLLLLAKIGNKQFEETTLLNFKEKIQKKMEAFQELWANENIKVTASLSDAQVKMNTALADILLNNLLSNAAKHNFSGGSIHILLIKNSLVITNTSKSPSLDPARLYSKFYTVTKGTGNTGLGLSIVKHICDASQFAIAYSYRETAHSFTINW